MKILLSGDLHLGRSSSGMKSSAETIGVGIRATEAWQRIVDLALERGVGAVILSGDLIDHSNKYMESAGPFSRGLKQLAKKGIRTIAIAGNHDSSTLASMAREWTADEFAFTFLGRDGTWEECVLANAGKPALRIVGWSFPADSYQRDPVESFPQHLSRELPILGLVHGDLDVADSRYAPLSRNSLARQPVEGWLLGHIHIPSLRTNAGEPWMLYPGTPQALDAGEREVHGVWITEVIGSTILPPTLVPLSSVRYSPVPVDLSDCGSDQDARVLVRQSLVQSADAASEEGGGVMRLFIADLTLSGTMQGHSAKSFFELLNEDLDFGAKARVTIRKCASEVTAPLNIASIAQGKGLAAELAKLVLDLESDAVLASSAALLRQVNQAVAILESKSKLSEGDDENRFAPDAMQVRRRLALTARRLIPKLIVHNESATEGVAL